jgi:glycosyltransferase involved in cell wall biosynthesis
MTRPIVYDATHLVTRWRAIGSAGIGCVDLAYARHFAAHPRLACGAHYGYPRPHVYSRERLAGLLAEIAPRDREDEAIDDWAPLRGWLLGGAPNDRPAPPRKAVRTSSRLRDLSVRARCRLAHDPPRALPDSAIYLNIAQHACEYPIFFDWLSRRPDLRPVFFVHDLLPLDCPEFFRRGYARLFRRRLDTILRHAGALLTTTQVVAERLEREYAISGRRAARIHVQPLASTLERAGADGDDPELAHVSYFVAVSTLEPRKNHLLLLNIWRALASGSTAPKLVLVGGAGWENEQSLDMLNRCAALRDKVLWVRNLSAPCLRRLVANANALLMPSFAEGYGLPVVEALGLGVPAIVSDIPTFREVAQGRALFLSPIDGKGWKGAVLDFSDRGGRRRLAALETARAFATPDWAGYFSGVERFLGGL